MSEPTVTYTTLTAMFTPAMFLLATGSFIASTSSRMSRVVDRIRVLNEQADAICRGSSGFDFRHERLEHISTLLDRMDERGTMIRWSLTFLYLANSLFVGTSLVLAVDVQLGKQLEWIATGLAVGGASLILAAGILLLREARVALESNRTEVHFYKDLQRMRLNAEEATRA
ncbi:MAG: DUF2721 domain-containing protein [Isosphaeraceae bacterium]|nr:DUF2721 domain-containing protein [Isosphaeraceae bacterium]